VTNPGLRASDEDRQRTVGALERHTAAGRLDLNEFSDRVARAYAAATHADLAAIVRDLPPDRPASDPQGTDHRQLLVALLIAAVTIAILGVVLAIAR
jgi:hypothetical protein